MTAPRRTPLGRATGTGYRTDVFATASWIEVDEVDGGEIRRRRVPHDEIALVTWHRERRIGLGILLSLPGLLFATGAIAMAVSHEGGGEIAGAIVLACFALLFLGPGLYLALVPRQVVAIMGVRSKATMHFDREARARAAFEYATACARSARGAPPA